MINEAGYDEWKNHECTKKLVELILEAKHMCVHFLESGDYLSAYNPLVFVGKLTGQIDSYNRVMYSISNFAALDAKTVEGGNSDE